MTISSENRKAGPFAGNDSTTVFPFEFKVFSASDLQVIQAVSATVVESTLTLDADYTVSLSADQDANPGGNITLNSALASGYTLTIVSSLENLQPVDFTNQGGFYPSVLNKAFDRLTIMVQQVNEQVGRAVKSRVSSNVDLDDYLDSVADAVAQAQAHASTASSKADSADSSSQSASTSAQNAAASESAAAGYAASMVPGQFAIKSDTQASAYTTATATGTADAITASYTPPITELTNGLTLLVRAASANATTTPTFTPASGTIAAATIVKFAGAPLVAGDIAGAGHWLELQYDSTLGKWVLKNPATAITAAACSGNSATATKLATARTINGVSFDGSANITLPAASTSVVLTATAAASLGAIGTYAFLCGPADTTYAAGATVAGSSLKYAGVQTDTGNPYTSKVIGSTAPSGTWRCMGYVPSGSSTGGSLWLRIS